MQVKLTILVEISEKNRYNNCNEKIMDKDWQRGTDLLKNLKLQKN